jgi:hypothetical protein
VTREPFTPAEVGIDDESLHAVAAELEDYAQLAHQAPSAMLVRSVMDAVDAEPAPRRGWLATLTAPGGTARRSLAVAATAGVVVVAIGIGFLLGRVADAPAPGVGGSPAPSAVTTPSPTPTPTPTPTPSPSVAPTQSVQESFTQQAEPSATESDDHGGNSGPGGGDDSSGPGGGDG